MERRREKGKTHFPIISSTQNGEDENRFFLIFSYLKVRTTGVSAEMYVSLEPLSEGYRETGDIRTGNTATGGKGPRCRSSTDYGEDENQFFWIFFAGEGRRAGVFTEMYVSPLTLSGGRGTPISYEQVMPPREVDFPGVQN